MFGLGTKTAITYEVPCTCGHPLRGYRQTRHQVVACPMCGHSVFVLPASPLQKTAKPERIGRRSRSRSSRASWFVPLLTGLGLLGLLVVAFWVFLPMLGRGPASKSDGEVDDRDPHAYIEAGRRALSEGKFNKAQREFETAATVRERHRDSLSPTEARRLAQLQRQTGLLAALLGKSLQEILQQAALERSDDEWGARFKQDYLGKAVVFDDIVRRDAAGRPVLAYYVVRLGEQNARLALEDLKLLRELPLEIPQRLIFGARLASVGREPGGGWVVRFDPDSGALLTDPSAAASCLPPPLDDEVIGLLQRQADWLER